MDMDGGHGHGGHGHDGYGHGGHGHIAPNAWTESSSVRLLRKVSWCQSAESLVARLGEI